jgi:hemolysin activation/secretion protein
MNQKLHKALQAALWALAFAPAAAGAQSAPRRDPNEQLMREQTEKLREELLRQAPADIQFEQPAATGRADQGFPADLPVSGPVFPIHAIRQAGDRLLGEQDFHRVVAPFVGQSLGAAHINVLLERINHALVAAGYTTSRAYVGSQNLGTGTLVVTIVAGRIEQLVYDGAALPPDGHDRPGVRLAMPMRQGDVLRLRDIEQAVDQLNRLRRNNVQVQIRPGTQPGGSIVEFLNRPQDGARYSATLDNQGSAATGRLRVQLAMERGDTLGLMDALSLGLTTSADTNALYGTLAIPLGYGTLAGMASFSEYQNLVGDTALVYGTSRSYSLSYNRLIHRDQDSKTAFDIALTRRISSRMINNATLTPQSQAVLRLGINRLARFQAGPGAGQWTVDAGISHGLRSLGADRDAADLPAEAARYQFTKLEASATLERPIAPAVVWRSRAAGQWSRRPLYSSEQIFAGGVASVRGFAESAQGGDRGAYWRNEWALQSLPPLAGRVRYEPYLFLDMAHVTTLADHASHGLASTGAGMRAAYARGYAEIIVGKPLRQPAGLPPGGWRVNLSAACQF